MGEGVDVIGDVEGFWEGGQAAPLAALAAAAPLDPHDVARKVFAPVRAVELQNHGARLRGLAAPAVGTRTTGTWPVPPCGRAAGEGDLRRLSRPHSALAFLSFLLETERSKQSWFRQALYLLVDRG